MKCCHTIDGSLPPRLGGNGGSDTPSPIGAIGSGGFGGGGYPGALDPSGASISI